MARLRLLTYSAAVTAVVGGLMTAVLAGEASACSPVPGDTEAQRYQRATFVFEGKILSETFDPGTSPDQYDDKYRYAVKVGKEWKGDVPRRVDVSTSISGAQCGIRLTKGTTYLIFAFGDATDHQVETHLFSGTRPAASGPPTTTLPPQTTTPRPPTTTPTP
ncbi:hypothetical protein [Actinosynnema sp. NPDC020468]|uniref:hypothetical protein n=1 Tax=Actinosynnema sp. NPDC020468 TaxID=3154488 RepID=UPI003411E15B